MKSIVSNLYADYLRYIDRFRAIPWETDMLKPVERRTLLTVHEVAKTKFVKSAKVVGAVLGNLHPHGEASCVDVLVGMVQNGLVEGQGNWGTDKAKDYIKAASTRYCVTGDTLIPTENGIVRIDQISKTEDIEIKVSDYRGLNTLATKFFKCDKFPIIKIITNCGYELKGSENHPILVVGSNLNFEWKQLKDINTNDIVIIKGNSYNKDIDKYSDDIFKLLGGLISEGWHTYNEKKHYYKLGFNNTNLDYYCEISKYAKEFFGYIGESDQNLPSGKVCKGFEICNKLASDKATNELDFPIGLSEMRKIPNIIWIASKRHQAIFLQYLFYGDGSINIQKDTSNFTLIYISKSLELIKNIQTLLIISFNITSSITKDKSCHKLNICGILNLRKFNDSIGLLFEKQKKLDCILSNSILNNNKNRSKDDRIPILKQYLYNKYSKIVKYKEYKEIKRYYYDINNIHTIKDNLPFIDDLDIDKFKFIQESGFRFFTINNIENLLDENVYSLRINSDNHSFITNCFISHNTECKALKFLDDGFSEFLDFVPWEEFEYANEPHFLPFYIPIGLVGEGLIQGISLHTTKIPRYKFEDLLIRLYELVTDSPTKTTIIPNIENNDIFEDQPGELEKILSTGEGIIYAIPKYKIQNNSIYIYGKSPISKFNKLDAFNEKYEKDNGKPFAIVIDSSDTKLEVIVSPKKGSCDKKFIEVIMDLVMSKIHIKCNVVIIDGTIVQKGIDEILINTFNMWKSAYLAKITKDLSLLNIKLDEFNIILIVRSILAANPNVKLIKDICNLNTSQYSNEEIERVCSKYRIKTLIEAHIDIIGLQKSITDTQYELQNIDQFAINRIKSILGK